MIDDSRIGLKRMPPSKLKQLKATIYLVKDLWRPKKQSALGEKLTKSFKNQYSAENMNHFRNAEELLDNIEQNMKVMAEINDIHSSMSMVSTFFQLIMMTMISEGAKELTDDHFHDMKVILGSSKDTESADVPKKLELMAKSIVSAKKQKEFCEVDPSSGMAWLKENIPEVGVMFRDFIEKNSHRALKEFELATITWGMRPGIIIEMLQATVRYSEDVSSLTKTNIIADLKPEDVVKQLKSPKKGSTKWMLTKLIPYSQRSVQYRELSKSNFIAVVHEFRKAFRHLGTMMTQEGCLSHPDLIFYLTAAELRSLMKHKNAELIKRASRRQRLHPQLNKLRYPELIQGMPQPIRKKKPSEISSDNEVIT